MPLSIAADNTMRELSNRCKELHAMFMLNDTQRMIVNGAGGGADWLQEHLRQDYLAAWSNPIHHTSPAEQDAGVRVMAMSRWNNYYAAGIQQAKRDYHSDGVYLRPCDLGAQKLFLGAEKYSMENPTKYIPYKL